MMWHRAALCVAGMAGIAVGAVLADETMPSDDPDVQRAAVGSYLGGDPASAQAARRVLRLLEILGVQRTDAPHQLPAELLAELDHVPPPPTALPVETAAADFPPEANAAPAEAELPLGRAVSTLGPVSPEEFAALPETDAARPVNDLRDPTRTASDLAQGLRAVPEASFDPAAMTVQSGGGPGPMTVGLVSPASPPAPIDCPAGMTSSRRTVRRAHEVAEVSPAAAVASTPAARAESPPAALVESAPAARNDSLPAAPVESAPLALAATAPPAPAAITPAPATAPIVCPDGMTSSRRTVRRAGEVAQTPAVPETTAPTTVAAIPASGPLSGRTATTLPPLPPLRPDSQPEPISLDAVLEPQTVAIAKHLPEHRQADDSGLTALATDDVFAPDVAPALERRPSEPPAPEVSLRPDAASPRTARLARSGPPRETTLAQLPTALRTPPAARIAELPQPDALRLPVQSPPQMQVAPPPPALPGRPAAIAAGDAPALLHVGVREQRLLRTAENVVRVVSERDGVCDVLLFTPREIAVVGKQQGTVKVEIWYDGQGLNRASYLVAVNGGDGPRSQPETDAQKIERLIAYLFPQSRVSLVREPARLIVRGSAASRTDAVEIMSTVRRSQLIPVTDEIVVQPESK